MANIKYIVNNGDKHGLLTLIREVEKKYYLDRNGKTQSKRMVECSCGCGTKSYINELVAIKRGLVKSCGCLGKGTNKDIKVGDVFGHLKVKEIFQKRNEHWKDKNLKWTTKCECRCQKIIEVTIYHLLSGHTISCGCRDRDISGILVIKHGLSKERLYGIWNGMHQRCYNPQHIGYKHWGGKGIRICEEWKDYVKFREWALLNGYTDNIKTLSLHRKNSDKDYFSENCIWLTKKEHSRLHWAEKEDKIKRLEKENRQLQEYIERFCDINHFDSVMNNNKNVI